MMDPNGDEPNYYINMHVEEKLVRDPHLKYVGGTRIRILEDPDTISYYELYNIVQNGLAYHTLLSVHYYIPDSRSFDDLLRLIWNDSTIIEMLNIWLIVKSTTERQ